MRIKIPGESTPPKRLSRELRRGKGRALARRRKVVGLSFLSASVMGLIGLYQMGILRHLPEPPLRGFDADKVDASEEAYERFSLPDGFLGLISYSVTAALAAAGGKRRARTRPILPLALAAKAGMDAAQAGRLTWDQWARHRAFCFWCLMAAGSTFAVLPMTLPEAREAWKRMRSQA